MATLIGTNVNDHLFGTEAADSMSGGNGNDLLDWSLGNDTLDGGADVDAVNYLSMGSGTQSGIVIDLANGYAIDSYGFVDTLISIEQVYGSFYDDTVSGDSANNMLQGFEGNDSLGGGGGTDMLYGADGDDQISGDSGRDTLYGAGGNDTMAGGADDDYLLGFIGADLVTGGAGADILGYLDVSDSPEAAWDVITDFDFGTAPLVMSGPVTTSVYGVYGNELVYQISTATGSDRIEISSHFDANTAEDGVQPFAWIGTSTFSGTAGELRYEVANGHTFILGDTDGDAAADFKIELSGQTTNDAGDTGDTGDTGDAGNAGDGGDDCGGTDDTDNGNHYGEDGATDNNPEDDNNWHNTAEGDGDGNGKKCGGSDGEQSMKDMIEKRANNGSGADETINGFQQGTDKVDLSSYDANCNVTGDQAFTFIGSNAFSHTAAELRFEIDGGQTYIYGDMDGDGAADLSIHLVGAFTLASSDFIM